MDKISVQTDYFMFLHSFIGIRAQLIPRFSIEIEFFLLFMLYRILWSSLLFDFCLGLHLRLFILTSYMPFFFFVYNPSLTKYQ